MDGAHPGPGDGTRQRPFGALAQALEGAGAGRGPRRVHLAEGVYEGPFELPEGVRLQGAGEATVLRAPGPQTVVRARGDAALARLALRGGGWGLEGQGRLELEEVSFSGQGLGAVRLVGGRLEARAVRLEAGAPETVGVELRGQAGARVREGRLSGPYRRGVWMPEGGQVHLEDVRFQGPATALEQEGGASHLVRVWVEGGAGPAVWGVNGALRLEAVTVTGHEYALAAHQARLQVRGFTSVGARRAGLAVVSSGGTLEEVAVRDSGPFGAVQLVDSDVTLRGLRVEGADAYGVQATNGRLRARDVTLTRLHSSEGVFGDGLHLRGGVVEVEGLEVRDAVGSGVLAAQGAEVVLREASLLECQQAGVTVESFGTVRARGLRVEDSAGPALAALRDGTLHLEALSAQDNAGGLLWAQCEGETRVVLERSQPEDVRGLEAPCVERPSP